MDADLLNLMMAALYVIHGMAALWLATLVTVLYVRGRRRQRRKP